MQIRLLDNDNKDKQICQKMDKLQIKSDEKRERKRRHEDEDEDQWRKFARKRCYHQSASRSLRASHVRDVLRAKTMKFKIRCFKRLKHDVLRN